MVVVVGVGLAAGLRLLAAVVEAEAGQGGHVWFARSSSDDVGGAWWHWVVLAGSAAVWDRRHLLIELWRHIFLSSSE